MLEQMIPYKQWQAIFYLSTPTSLNVVDWQSESACHMRPPMYVWAAHLLKPGQQLPSACSTSNGDHHQVLLPPDPHFGAVASFYPPLDFLHTGCGSRYRQLYFNKEVFVWWLKDCHSQVQSCQGHGTKPNPCCSSVDAHLETRYGSIKIKLGLCKPVDIVLAGELVTESPSIEWSVE